MTPTVGGRSAGGTDADGMHRSGAEGLGAGGQRPAQRTDQQGECRGRENGTQSQEETTAVVLLNSIGRGVMNLHGGLLGGWVLGVSSERLRRSGYASTSTPDAKTHQNNRSLHLSGCVSRKRWSRRADWLGELPHVSATALHPISVAWGGDLSVLFGWVAGPNAHGSNRNHDPGSIPSRRRSPSRRRGLQPIPEAGQWIIGPVSVRVSSGEALHR